MERAYTIDEFCQTYKIGKTKACQLIKEKRLKAVSVGKKKIIRSDDAESWLASLSQPEKDHAA